MNLIAFRRKLVTPMADDTPMINISSTGRVSFNKGVSDRITFDENSSFALLQDQDNTEDWYVSFTHEWGVPVRASKNATQSILDYFKVTAKSYSLSVDLENKIDLDGVVYYKLFTKPLSIKMKGQELAMTYTSDNITGVEFRVSIPGSATPIVYKITHMGGEDTPPIITWEDNGVLKTSISYTLKRVLHYLNTGVWIVNDKK